MEQCDVRSITRNSSLVETRIEAGIDHERFILCGESKIGNFQADGVSILTSYASRGATDFEHDSAKIISIPLVGVEPKIVESRWSQFDAWVEPDSYDQFNVPSPDYDPFDNPEMCDKDYCNEPHPIIDYTPEQTEYTRKLYERLLGEKLTIEWRVKNESN